MLSHSLRMAGIATCASALLLGTPSKSHAIFGWFSNCCKPQVAYMPVAPAPVAQTCQYMPVTSYRTVYKQVPVTTYQPVTSQSWCSCQPVTTYRPVTTYVTQAQQVPFTTYKPVYAAAPAPAVTTYSAPAAAVSYAAPAPSTPCCGASGPTTPPLSYATPPPTSGSYTPPAVTSPGTTSPSYGAPTTQPTLPVSPPPGITTQKQTPTVAPPTNNGQQTGYGNPPAATQPYIPQSERTATLPRYDRGASAYNTASYSTATQWQAERSKSLTDTQSRVAASQPAMSHTATTTTGGQFRWRPAQN